MSNQRYIDAKETLRKVNETLSRLYDERNKHEFSFVGLYPKLTHEIDRLIGQRHDLTTQIAEYENKAMLDAILNGV